MQRAPYKYKLYVNDVRPANVLCVRRVLCVEVHMRWLASANGHNKKSMVYE